MKNKQLSVALVSALTLCSVNFSAQAAQWDISISNLTHGNLFTPLLAAAHDNSSHLFQVGSAATAGVRAMAECGDLTTLLVEAGAAGAVSISDLVGGGNVLMPGATVTGMLTTTATNLTVTAMILPSNDAFMGLDAQMIPAAAGTYTYYLNGYDAGTEANNELQDGGGCTSGLAGFPGGSGDTGGVSTVAADSNTNIHVHRGLLGDTDDMGGTSDVNSTIHRWQNPVAKVVVIVTP